MEKLAPGKYIIFLDVDGTVFDGKEVPKKTADALEKARENGHKVFLNTGRAHCIVLPDILEAVKPDGIVGAMGTAITVGDELIFSAGMKKEDVEFLMRFGEEKGYFTIAESKERLVMMNGGEVWGQKNFIDTADELFEKYPDMTVCKVSYINKVPEEELVILRERIPAIYANSKYAEIPLVGCNKATGIERVCEYYSVGIDQTIAMGDSGNDYDMIKFAGIGVAMGNATEAIKEIADFVTTDCREGGVGYAIEKLIFEKEI